MNPADQSLSASKDRLFSLDRIFRLIKYLKLFLVDCLLYLADEPHSQHRVLMHLFVIECNCLRVIITQEVAGRFGLTAALLDIHLMILICVKTQAQPDTHLCNSGVHFLLKPFHDGLIILLAVKIDIKVCILTAGDSAVFHQELLQDLRHRAQDTVSELSAEHLVHQVQLLDAHGTDVHLAVGEKAFSLLYILTEILHGIEAGQLVSLRLIDHMPVIIQFNDISDPGKNDLRHIVWLFDKVRRALIQAFQLCLLLGCQDDHRNLQKILIALANLQKFKTIQLRHQNIQHDQRDFFSLLIQNGQSLLAVLGIQDLVLRIQDKAEHLAVDIFIIHDQNLLTPAVKTAVHILFTPYYHPHPADLLPVL